MKVKDIQVDGFGVWSGLSVDSIPETMTLVYGPNEAGKTTLMQFLRAMLYGFTPERRARYLPPVHGGVPGGAIRVTGPGGGYEIRRHAQLTDSGVMGQLAVTGQDGLSQGQHRLSMLLGQIDEPIFTNVFAIGIRELQELSTLDDTSAADELYKLSSGLDRVSLVDVLRSLRSGRERLVGKRREEDDDAAVLAALVTRRERLRDEVEQLTRLGRRWGELAGRRRSQEGEIDQLLERIDRWQTELRGVEVGAAVQESWRERATLAQRIAEDEARSQLPDEAPSQLIQIEALLQERQGKLEDIKSKRRELRQRAEELPLNRRLLDMQGKIEAAGEQATWIEALEEQITRLEQQINKARTQCDADAEKLGWEDQGDGHRGELPDLSRQTLAALAVPAKEIKTNLFVLKQARDESRQHQAQADKVSEKLTVALRAADATNLQDAMRRQAEIVANLRARIQLEQHLEKLRRHHRDLEKEVLELATNEAYPLEQRVLLFVPFLFGGIGLIYGMVHVLGWTWFFDEPDPTWGMTMVFMGLLCFFLWYTVRDRGYSGTSLDLEDCERQIDAARRQIRELESERDELDSRIPAGAGSLDVRLREAESLQTDLEAALPAFHAQQAALQASKTSRTRAAEAAEGLKAARRGWTSTLRKLGLNESMSPNSVRQLSENYEQLQASRRRLEELEAERDLRRRERTTIAKRIEALYLEVLQEDRHDDAGRADRPDSRRPDGSRAEKDRGDRDRADKGRGDSIPAIGRTADPQAAKTHLRRVAEPLDQLRELQEALAREHQWIKRRHELRDQDVQWKRQHVACVRTIERCEQQRRSLWAKCGVATAEQFYELVDVRTRLADHQQKMADLDKQIRGMMGTHVVYEDVARELEGKSAEDLTRRYESLEKRIGETQARLATLRTSQGELSQEMKQLGEDNRLATLRLELECVQRQIDTLVRRWQTLAVASGLLEEVCATFERERQPETLREASSFLSQLTAGKYNRVWTPLGTNRLKIDSAEGQSLSIDLLSRGTREAVFIALRLSLAAAYARRGVMLPLVLDDVLVNFDRDRALYAAQTLKTFAEMGHQVFMFTCHKHIAEIFQEIDVQVRRLPPQGVVGRATVMSVKPTPVAISEPVVSEPVATEPILAKPAPVIPLPIVAEIPVAAPAIPVVELPVPEEAAVPAEPTAVEEAQPEPEPAPVPPVFLPVLQDLPEPATAEADADEDDADDADAENWDDTELEPDSTHELAIGWNWFDRDPEEAWSDPDDAPEPVAESLSEDAPESDEEPAEVAPPIEGIWERHGSWTDPGQAVSRRA